VSKIRCPRLQIPALIGTLARLCITQKAALCSIFAVIAIFVFKTGLTRLAYVPVTFVASDGGL
jgi:hypothetical protein